MYSGASGDSVQPAGPWAASAWSRARISGGRSSIAASTSVRSSAHAARSRLAASCASSSRRRSRATSRSRRQTQTTCRQCCGSSITPHDVARATYLAQSSLHRPTPKRHRKLSPRRVRRAGRLIAPGIGVAPAGRELLSVAIAVAPNRSSVASEAVSAAWPRGPAARRRATNAAQR